jgi:membrane protease YdiL (CAAX protease family)
VTPENFSSLAEPAVEMRPGLPLPDLGDGSSEPIDPNNPPWGVAQALLTWITSLALLLVVPLVAVIPYIVYRTITFGSDKAETLLADKNFIFISILGIFPTHILLFIVIWLVVTNRGSRPFWQTLGWSWPENFGPWKSVFLAVGLLFVGWLMTLLFGGAETQLDQLINSSYKARVATAILAVATGPLVEELLYRGVLYAAFQRAIGVFGAVVIVSALFAGVHVFQYYNNLGVIAVISVLSVALTLVRARTGRLLPSFFMHLVFNGIQSVILVLQPIVQKLQPGAEEKAVAYIIEGISRHLG